MSKKKASKHVRFGVDISELIATHSAPQHILAVCIGAILVRTHPGGEKKREGEAHEDDRSREIDREREERRTRKRE